jgi:hypothetical protein
LGRPADWGRERVSAAAGGERRRGGEKRRRTTARTLSSSPSTRSAAAGPSLRTMSRGSALRHHGHVREAAGAGERKRPPRGLAGLLLAPLQPEGDAVVLDPRRMRLSLPLILCQSRHATAPKPPPSTPLRRAPAIAPCSATARRNSSACTARRNSSAYTVPRAHRTAEVMYCAECRERNEWEKIWMRENEEVVRCWMDKRLCCVLFLHPSHESSIF